MCLGKTNSISGMLIGSLSEKAELADTKAQSAIAKSGAAEIKANGADIKADKAQEKADVANRTSDQAKGKAEAADKLAIDRDARLMKAAEAQLVLKQQVEQ